MSATIFESEPNYTKATADILQVDATDNTALMIGTIAGSERRRLLLLSASGVWDARPQSERRSDAQRQISVEDAPGRKLFESEPRNGVASGSFNVTAGQDVYIRTQSQNRSIGDYQLQLSLGSIATPPATPPNSLPTTPPNEVPATALTEIEANNSKATANKTNLGASLQIQESSSESEDDFFALRATRDRCGLLQRLGKALGRRFPRQQAIRV